MRSGAFIERAARVIAIVVALVGVVEGTSHALRDRPRRLVISIYKSEAAASAALNALKNTKDLDVESRALVVKGANGKVKVHDQRAKGTRSGQAVAAIGAAMGSNRGIGVGSSPAAGVEYLSSAAIGMPSELVLSLKVALNPGDAAVVSAVEPKYAAIAERVQAQGAARVLTHDLPATIAGDESEGVPLEVQPTPGPYAPSGQKPMEPSPKPWAEPPIEN